MPDGPRACPERARWRSRGKVACATWVSARSSGASCSPRAPSSRRRRQADAARPRRPRGDRARAPRADARRRLHGQRHAPPGRPGDHRRARHAHLRARSTAARTRSRTSCARRACRPGDKVAIVCRNHRGFVEAMIAGSKLGTDLLYLNTALAGPAGRRGRRPRAARGDRPRRRVRRGSSRGAAGGRLRVRRRRPTRAPTAARPTLDELVARGDTSDLRPPEPARRA